jgi:hypothetical protein
MIINSLCRTHRTLRLGGKPFVPEKIERAKRSEAPKNVWPTIFAPSPRKTAFYLESAKRFVSTVSQYQRGGKEEILAAARDEKRRLHKFAYSMIASASPPDLVWPAFVTAGLSGKTASQEECENEMIIAGTQLALKNAHPILIMRTMTAFLGFSVFDSVESWLAERFGGGKDEEEELIIPGDLSEILSTRPFSSGQISLAVHLAGPQLVAATLAGCPRDTIDLIKSMAYSPLGEILLDRDIGDARNSLSSDELSDAQNAFVELLTSLDEEPAAAVRSEEEDWQMGADEGLVSDISSLILELDERALKSVVSSLDPKLVASLIQAMEPIAHDRLFSCVASGRSKKILDALEASSPLSTNELTRRAQIFAQKVLAEIAPRGKTLGASLQLSAKLRQLLTSILSRE